MAMRQNVQLQSLFLLTICLSTLTHGLWTIDRSCDIGGASGAGRLFVRRGMTNAFNLARDAQKVAMEAPMDINKRRLVERLFGTAEYALNGGSPPHTAVAAEFGTILQLDGELDESLGQQFPVAAENIVCQPQNPTSSFRKVQ
jgi:hypothetical protein